VTTHLNSGHHSSVLGNGQSFFVNSCRDFYAMAMLHHVPLYWKCYLRMIFSTAEPLQRMYRTDNARCRRWPVGSRKVSAPISTLAFHITEQILPLTEELHLLHNPGWAIPYQAA